MKRRTTEAAFAAYLQRARQVAACFTAVPLALVPSTGIVGARRLAFLPPFTTVRLKTTEGGVLGLTLSVEIAVEGRDEAVWAVERSYRFELLGGDGRELFAYHWHPYARSDVRYPHAHVGPVLTGAGRSPVHWPTGRVLFSDIARVLIAELGVHPKRADWDRTLDPASDHAVM